MWSVVDKSETSTKSVINWLEYNYMNLIESKCKLLISGNKEEIIIASVGATKIIESIKLLYWIFLLTGNWNLMIV